MVSLVREQETRRLQVDGKFFRAGGERVFVKMVSYGPFPEPRPDAVLEDRGELKKIAAAGFNAVRVYGEPPLELFDAARNAGLWVFVGLKWECRCDFLSRRSAFSAARVRLIEELERWGKHPAAAGVFVANEIPADLVRWMGVVRVRAAVEELIDLGREHAPEMLFAYANYPTTEYLEPDNADFTAMNVYLEDREAFRKYLPRLHHVAGDRPVLLSEFGLDTQRNGEEAQRDAAVWCLDEALQAAMAGVTYFAWSDWWQNESRVMDEWSFGLVGRDGGSKLALDSLSEKLPSVRSPEDGLSLAESPMFSIVICTHNGAHRMDTCLRACTAIQYPDYEVIVVDDGSENDLEGVVKKYPAVRLIQVDHMGLSGARNVGAEHAKGEIIAYTDDDCEPDAGWLMWLADAFHRHGWDACGGPNLAPLPDSVEDVDEAVVASAPGAPTHVMLGDLEAEHLPGCNLVVRKSVWEKVGGFSDVYRVAGDDVDFCWRLREEGFRLGFAGGGFVWHRRRTTLWRYLKQQYGYGKAEALLMRDHAGKFVRGGGARWKGRVYAGGAMSADEGAVIYHGVMGTAPYQQVHLGMQPVRQLPYGFGHAVARRRLAVARALQPVVRRFARFWYSLRWRGKVSRAKQSSNYILVDNMERRNDYESRWWSEGVKVGRINVLDAVVNLGWDVLENDSEWDLRSDDMRMLIAVEPGESGNLILARVEMGEKSGGVLPDDFENAMRQLRLQRM